MPGQVFRHDLRISIHALCEEGDSRFSTLRLLSWYFYPRPLRGGRLETYVLISRKLLFLSTPSARRATREIKRGTYTYIFLSTPSARRATRRPCGPWWPWANFYPRPLRGGRRQAPAGGHLIRKFLSTPSARRATRKPPDRPPCTPPDFYPRPLRGGRPSRPCRSA